MIEDKKIGGGLTAGLTSVHETEVKTQVDKIGVDKIGVDNAQVGTTETPFVVTDKYETNTTNTTNTTSTTNTTNTGCWTTTENRTGWHRRDTTTKPAGSDAIVAQGPLRDVLLKKDRINHIRLNMFLGADVTNGGVVKAPESPTLASWNAFFAEHYGPNYLAALLPKDAGPDDIKQAQLDFLEAFVSANGMMIMMARGEVQRGDDRQQIMDGLITHASQLALDPGALGGDVVLPGTAHMQAMCYLMHGAALPDDLRLELASTMAVAMKPVVMGRMAGASHNENDPYASMLLTLKSELDGLEGEQRDIVLQQILLSWGVARVDSFAERMREQRALFSESWSKLEDQIASLDVADGNGLLKSFSAPTAEMLSPQTLVDPPTPPGEMAASSQVVADAFSDLLFGDLIFDYEQKPRKVEDNLERLLASIDRAEKNDNFLTRLGDQIFDGLKGVDLSPRKKANKDNRADAKLAELQKDMKDAQANVVAATTERLAVEKFADGVAEKNRNINKDEARNLEIGVPRKFRGPTVT